MTTVTTTYQPTCLTKVTVKKTGKTFYAAPTGANDGSCYYVTILPHHHLCTCADFKYRHRDCKHIRAVLEHLEAVRTLRTSAVIAEAAQIARVVSQAHQRADAEKRDQALMYTDDRAFSMFKS